MRLTRPYRTLLLAVLALTGSFVALSASATSRGFSIVAIDQNGSTQSIPLYRKMFGVVIGIGRYADRGIKTLNYAVRDARDGRSTVKAKFTFDKMSQARLPSEFSAVSTATDPASGLPKRIRHEKTGIELVLVPAGEFAMGSSDGESHEKPIHRVYLDAYYIGVTEVTNAQFWTYWPGYTHGDYGVHSLNGDFQPVEDVSWNDAKAYCDWAGLALPTEAQWEKAARGKDGRKYPWGKKWPPPRGAGNFADQTAKRQFSGWGAIDGYDDGFAVSSPVGTFGSSESYGTRDMAGNVSEWCADWFGDYPAGAVRNPTGPTSGVDRVVRGTSWGDHDARSFAATTRSSIDPYGLSGFRVSCVIRQDTNTP